MQSSEITKALDHILEQRASLRVLTSNAAMLHALPMRWARYVGLLPRLHTCNLDDVRATGLSFALDANLDDAFADRVARFAGDKRCLYATPKVHRDHNHTLGEFLAWTHTLAEAKLPRAFVAQSGCDRDDIPWDELDVLALDGGDDWWMRSDVAIELALIAHRLGKPVHLRRVATPGRLVFALRIGARSIDGACFGELNVEELIHQLWIIERWVAQPPLFGGSGRPLPVRDDSDDSQGVSVEKTRQGERLTAQEKT